MMQRAAALPPKALCSTTFSSINLEKWKKIQNYAAQKGIPITKPSGNFNTMGNTVHWSLIGNFLTIEVTEAQYMDPDSVLSYVTDMVNEAIR